MTERILVFKGERVTYYALKKEIICIARDDWFPIKEVHPIDVLGLEVRVTFGVLGFARVEGTELWSDGERWIIKG